MPKDPPSRALLDPAICCAPGLFLSLVRREEKPREGKGTTVEYAHGRALFIFTTSDALGCDDLRVLQGVVALAGRSRRILGPIQKDERLTPLRSMLSLSGAPAGENAVLVEASLAELGRAAGHAASRGGGMGRSITNSLNRLAKLKVRVSEDGREAGWRLLSWEEGEAGRGVRVALNPRTSACARAEARFALIDLVGARSLEGDVARLLHQRLSGWVDDGGRRVGAKSSRRRVGMETLLGYVWGPHGETTPGEGALRQRRATIRRSLDQLSRLGWSISPVAGHREMFDVVRRDVRPGGEVAGPATTTPAAPPTA